MKINYLTLKNSLSNYLTLKNSLFLILSIVAIILGNRFFLLFVIVLNSIAFIYYAEVFDSKYNTFKEKVKIFSGIIIFLIFSPVTIFILLILVYLKSIKKYFID